MSNNNSDMEEIMNINSDKNPSNEQSKEISSKHQETGSKTSEQIPAKETEKTVGQLPAFFRPVGPTKKWTANSECMTAIMELGYSEIVAEKALFHTGNNCSNTAVNWILEHPEVVFETERLNIEGIGPPAKPWSENSSMYKMVLVVNGGLKMGLGKIAAQVGHGSLNLYRMLERTEHFRETLNLWDQTGATKIVVKCDDDGQMLQLQKKCDDAGLPSSLICDAGHTQIAAGSMTVLAIFGTNEQVDSITGGLKLL